MLNREAAANARNRLERAIREHGAQSTTAKERCTELFELRRSSSEGIIVEVEAFVNTLANQPKEFERAFSEYRIEFRAFDGVVQEIDSKLQDVTVKSSAGAGAGVAAGAATALMGPTAAMAVATTFGTASTGTAIATLSGAAATNAALAWLGGGALVAGGGGMTAGSALLGLAGPVGWGLAGLAAAGGAAYMARANSKVMEEADSKRIPVEAEVRSLKAVTHAVTELRDLTQRHIYGLTHILKALRDEKKVTDYLTLTYEDKNLLTVLINHVRILAQLLNKTIDVTAP